MKNIVNIFAIIAICCLSNMISMNLKKMKEEEAEALVLNLESGSMYAGFAGDDAPRAVFPSIVGRPKHQGVMVGIGNKDAYVGDEANAKRGLLTLKTIAKRGLITEWKDLEKLIHHTFYNELRVAPEEHPALLSFSPNTPQEDKQKVLKTLFETFHVPKAYLSNKAELALYASGRITGTVLHIEEGAIYAVSIDDGKIIKEADVTAEVGGYDLTEYLIKILTERGYSFTTTAEKEVVKDIKYKLGYVAIDYEAEIKTGDTSSKLEKSYELPDGQVITVGNERFKVGEALFQPKLMGKDIKGIHEMINDSIQKCPESLREKLYSNIVLSGDTMFPGIQERLQKEISAIANGAKVKIIAQPDRKNLVWIGGSILTSLSTFESKWVQASDYKVKGYAAFEEKQ